jgi:hypothetical protein
MFKDKGTQVCTKGQQNPKFTPHQYLDKYVFSDLHEVFFYEFLHLLHEWLLRLKENHPMKHIRQRNSSLHKRTTKTLNLHHANISTNICLTTCMEYFSVNFYIFCRSGY